MLLQHYNYLAIKQLKSLIMGCPEGWLDWDTYGVFIQAWVWGYQPQVSFCSYHFQLMQNFPRSRVMLNYHIIKINFWLTLEVLKTQSEIACRLLDNVQNLFPIACDLSHFFVPRELLTHWKCTKEYNKDMCHTLHPYYSGNDKWDKQSLHHTVCSALKLALLRVKKLQRLCEMSIL